MCCDNHGVPYLRDLTLTAASAARRGGTNICALRATHALKRLTCVRRRFDNPYIITNNRNNIILKYYTEHGVTTYILRALDGTMSCTNRTMQYDENNNNNIHIYWYIVLLFFITTAKYVSTLQRR